MAAPLVETKFHRPAPHGGLVARPRLSELISHARTATLTLVSAPAGFGKTTVMAELANHPSGSRIAWLSLDAADDEPVTFWTYVIEALDRAVPGVGTSARAVLEGSAGSVDSALVTLLNALATIDDEVILVLDDVHVIEAPAIHEQLGYVLDRLPARAHLVMGSRSDPAFPLGRLRARGDLVEIRATDLRFSAPEAEAYFASMGLALSEADLATLDGRTEGWIAALQLAALSLKDRTDVSAFIAAFAGDHRYIVDYLVEEVLRRQPAALRDFLLRTSILSRFTGGLADAVTGGQGGTATIEGLERANLFVVALDDQRRWYRYHHLFGGVLHAHLTAELTDEVPLLHRRASDWFEAHGDRSAAVEHALRADDPDRVADLVELAQEELRQFRRNATLRRWLEALPRDVLERRPVLAVNLAGSILSENEVDGVDELLDAVERRMEAGEPSVVVDEAEYRRLPAMIELYRAAAAKMRGDLDGNLAHARRVLELVGADDHIGRGGAETFLGLAYWGSGDLEAGYHWYAQGMASLERGGLVADLVGGSIIAADIRSAEGRLSEAERIYASGLARATQTDPPLRGATDMHTGLAEVAYQRGRLDEASAHMDAGRRLGDELGFPREPYRWRVVRARLLAAGGDVDEALALLDEAERLYVSDFSPDIRPVAAIRARMLIAHGRVAVARPWIGRAGVAASDVLSYEREYEHTTLARLLVADVDGGRPDEARVATALLERLLAAAEDGHRHGSRLEILVVLALARHAAGDEAGALAALDAAVDIAEPEGYVRVFLDEGPAMTRLLTVATRRAGAPAYLQALRAPSPPPGRAGAPTRTPLIEPLSERELDVLRLLRSDLDGPDIANELVVSLNTLRTHTKNIYAKLGVNSRRAAVHRAEELGLL